MNETFEIIVRTRGVREAARGINDIGRNALSTRNALAFLRNALVVVASASVVAQLLNYADTLTTLRNRLRLVTDTTDELNTVQNTLFELSQRTRTVFEGNVTLFAKVARTTQRLSLTFQELVDITEVVALAIKISGATAQEATGGLIQFGQALASGVLGGDELRSVTENLPRLADAIGREFGIAGSQLQAFNRANPGVINTESIIRALRKETGLLGDEFSEVIPTISDGFTQLNNAVILFVGGINDSTGAGRAFSALLLTVADNLDIVAVAALSLIAVLTFNLVISQLAILNRALISMFGIIITGSATGVRALSALLVPLTLIRGTMVLIGAATLAALSPIGFLARAGAAAVIALLNPVRTLVAAFGVLRLAVLTNPLFVIGASVVAALVAAFILFEDQINAVIEEFGGLFEIFDNIVAGGIAAVQTIIQAWREFPRAIGDLAFQAANKLIDGLEVGVNASRALLSLIPGIDLAPQNLGDLINPFEGAADRILVKFVNNFNTIKEEFGGGVEFLQGKLNRLLETFNSFTSGGLEIDPSLLGNTPTVPGVISGDIESAGARRSRNELENLLQPISLNARATNDLAEAQRILNAAQQAGTDISEKYGLTQEEVLRRVERNILGVGNRTTDFLDTQRQLEDALKRGVITQQEFQTAIDSTELGEKLQEVNESIFTSFSQGFQAQLNQIRQFEQERIQVVKDAADARIITEEEAAEKISAIQADASRKQVSAVLGGFGQILGSAENTFGKWAEVVKNSEGEQSKAYKRLFAIQKAFAVASAIVNTAQAVVQALGSAPPPLNFVLAGLVAAAGAAELVTILQQQPGFQRGGSLLVGGQPGVDQNMLSINNQPVARVSRGERIDVVPQNQPFGGGSRDDRPINITVNVQANDPGEFKNSDRQIRRQLGNALEQARGAA